MIKTWNFSVLTKTAFLLAAGLQLSGCGGGSGSASDSNVTAQSSSFEDVDSSSNSSPSNPVVSNTTTESSATIKVIPSTFNISSSQEQKLTIEVSGLNNAEVNWSYSGCGWIQKSAGIYHAPEGMRTDQTVCYAHITATSIENPSITASALATITLAEAPTTTVANNAVTEPIVEEPVAVTPAVETPVIQNPVNEPKTVESASAEFEEQTETQEVVNTEEKIWLHPSFKRKGDGELANFNFMENSTKIKYYGMRYELPWSLFEKQRGQYDFSELDRVMKNAKERDLKVYVVLHDKTWFYDNNITNNWPAPGNKANNSTFYSKTNGNKGHTIRTSKRWNSNMEDWYIAALEAILVRRTQKSDYSQLEVISLGESSLAYGGNEVTTLKNLGYPGHEWYKDYLIRILHKATEKSNLHHTSDGAVKIAMNMNWIPGQSSPGVNGEWMQHEVLENVKNASNAVQAIEDVHANGHSFMYTQRVYKYTLDDQKRMVPKDRVWAHISCDSKHDGESAKDNLAMARALAKNITIRHRCDPTGNQTGSYYSEYENLLK